MQKSSAIVNRDRRFINIFPIIISIICFFIIKYTIKNPLNSNIGLGICNTLIGVWATCLGFLITAVSILLALNDNEYIYMLKQTGHYKTILISFMSCCFHILFTMSVMIVLTMMQKWSITIFALLCAFTVDVIIIMGICLIFLLIIILRVNN